MIESMLTTIDNPFNPFDDYDSWYNWDTTYGYHTSSFLARVCTTSPDLSDADQSIAIEDAIDEIVSENVLGIYKKISREVPKLSDIDENELD